MEPNQTLASFDHNLTTRAEELGELSENITCWEQAANITTDCNDTSEPDFEYQVYFWSK